MASNVPPEHHLGLPLSLADGASHFKFGECILVRIPGGIHVGGDFGDEATASSLPPTSTGSSPQHLAFIRDITENNDNSYLLDVYPVLSFTAALTQATLLPLPHLSRRHATPAAFGSPLSTVLGNWSTSRDSWLDIIPHQFVMPQARPFKRMDPPLIIPGFMLNRINLYRQALFSNTLVTDAHDQSHPPPNSGSGAEQRGHIPRPGQMGDGRGQSGSGETLTMTSPTLVGDGEGEQTADAKLEQFGDMTSDGVLILEGVDKDAEDADATLRDELFMLAHGSPMWMKELQKFLSKEEKERKQVQEERAARLARWRGGITMQPT
ncbi:hypothetical protein BYT27DRAFT_7189394 [Phlegmacium glaucopus]|nr:hypothetical protein BYT27DRAFT_7189394 [Phlegmacium glaucopus]